MLSSIRTYALAITMTMLFMGETKADEERFFIIPDDSFYGGLISLIDLKDGYAYQKHDQGNPLVKFRLDKESSKQSVSFTDNSRCHTISEYYYDFKYKFSHTQNYVAICGSSTKVPIDSGVASFEIKKFTLDYAGYYKWDVNDLEKAILKE